MTGARAVAAAAVVAAATIAAHAPAWRGDFVSDDVAEIAENPAIRTLWPPWVPMFAGTPLPHRPLPYYTFALNHAAHGLDTRGYHAVNLAIHLANGWLGWWVAREILRRRGAGEAADATAFAAVTLWLLHPLCTQAVDYVYQRMESLAALAILGTVACVLRAAAAPRRSRWPAAAVAAATVGMLCKETAVAAPVAALLVAWLACAWRPAAAWQSLRATLRARPLAWAALFATPLVAVALVVAQRDRYTDFGQRLAGPLLYAANQPLVIGSYLALAAWPARLCIDWYRLPVTSGSLLAPGIGAVAVAVAVACRGVGRSPGTALAILLFLALLAPTSSVLPVNDLMVEHRMYLPLLVLCVAAAAAGHAVATRSLAPRWRRPVLAAVTCLVAAALAAATWSRCHAYRSRIVMWADVVMKSPGNPRGWQTLGLELWLAGDPHRGLEAVDRSLAIVADSPRTLLTRAAILLDLGRPAEARAAAAAALAVEPEFAAARVLRDRAAAAVAAPAAD